MKKYLIGLSFFIFAIFILAGIFNIARENDDVVKEHEGKSIASERIQYPINVNKDIEEQPVQTTTTCKNDSSAIEIPLLLKPLPEQILLRKGYIASYNHATKCPNWVAWHLTAEHTDGPYKRDGICYFVDYDVNGPRQELEDWKNHGLPIDHGHMCPAGDNKWDEEAMLQSFLLTNMCPQNRELNNGTWRILEERCRGWARHYGDIYIVCGPIFSSPHYKTLGYNKIGIPDSFFKVILCMSKKAKAIGFVFPNEEATGKIGHYTLPIDKVEEITGIDFFHNLPDDIEDKIEASSDINIW